MADLLQRVEELQGLLKLVSERNQSLAPKPRQSLEHAIQLAEQFSTHLKFISENYVDLKSVDDNQKALLKNVEYWNKLSAGNLKGAELEELILKHSETLKSLYQAAIDILQICKFGDDELKLAADIGDNFVKFSGGCHLVKLSVTNSSYEILTKLEKGESIAAFLDLMVKRQIIKNYAFSLRVFERDKSPGWKEMPFLAAWRNNQLHGNHPVLFEIQGFDSKYRKFITGNWFNAFAYVVFNDQLRRMDLDYEIYTLVNFQSKSAGRVSTGDFDLILKVENRLFLVECKSGRLLENEGRDDYNEIIRKTETVKSAFESTRVSEYTFLLLCNPAVVDPKEASARLSESNIRVVTPDEIRGFVVDLLKKR